VGLKAEDFPLKGPKVEYEYHVYHFTSFWSFVTFIGGGQMNFYRQLIALLSIAIILIGGNAVTKPLPTEIEKIMGQPKYDHAIWGLYVKDLQTGEVLFERNSDKLFSPGSTTKIFSVEALVQAYGDDYRFKTPVYALGEVKDGQLQGNLILVAQGDLTMGGRQPDPNTIAYTKLDHIYANVVPGVVLTPENPLHGFNG
jgi:D-alanyl-D-alanine carboxypeptidase/D-alanyl-D-alanine-endopeptidase (penicillin-binding protein 4)